MLTCIGDVDVMYHYSNEIAVPVRHPPPSRLPADYKDRVKVYEIVDSHQPGFVYLTLTYILRRNTHDSTYVVAEYVSSPNTALSHEHYVPDDRSKKHGPAYINSTGPQQFCNRPTSRAQSDSVPCIHCFEWPSQASDWQKRYRNSGWPDSATVEYVVKQGCDVVGVARHQCRQDEWMSKHQWRLSFSRAEVILLNSWMPEQQIIYHMLRVFVKSERLTGRSDNSSGADTLSNYHIKTLMLWACEMKPRHWWNDGSSLITKCLQMLQCLEEWLTKNQGHHYFIDSLQFFGCFDQVTVDKVSAVVSSKTEDSLAQWFVDNYMRKCAELCPEHISLISSDVNDEIPDNAVNLMLRWRDHISGRTLINQGMSYF